MVKMGQRNSSERVFAMDEGFTLDDLLTLLEQILDVFDLFLSVWEHFVSIL